MAYLSVGGFGVAEGRFALPASGRGVAALRLSARESEAPVRRDDRVSLDFQDGTSYAMTCIQSGPDRGAWRVVLVQGAGRMSQVVRPKFYQSAPLKTVVADLLNEVGESPGALDLPTALPFWVRSEQTAQRALEAALLHAPEHAYHFGMDGKLNVKRPLPVPFEAPPMRLSADSARGMELLEGTPALTPQHSLGGRSIARIVHHVGGGPRTEVWYM